MRRLIAFMCMMACHTGNAQMKPTYPDIREVLTTLLTNYAIDKDKSIYLGFEKRITGWHVQEKKFTTGPGPAVNRIVWDASTSTYPVLPYDRQTATAAEIPSIVQAYMQLINLDAPTLDNFRRNLYHGYNGWDWDQIQQLKNQRKLSDTLTEALARAYSSYAVAYLYNQWGFSAVNNDTDRTPLDDHAPIPFSRVTKFIAYEQKAIELYDALHKGWPDYITPAGHAAVRKINERMFAFSSLMFAGYPKQANGFIVGLNYPDSLSTMARNMLDSVKQDGILITSGDNAFYPLWLLQEQGLRSDVAIINDDLLGLRRAIHYFNRRQGFRLLDIDSSVYMNPMLDFSIFYAPEGENTTLSLDTFMTGIYRHMANPIAMADGSTRTCYNTHQVYQAVPRASAQRLYGNVPVFDKLNVPIAKEYILLNGLMQLSLCNQNFMRRRIYYTFGPGDDEAEEGIKRRGRIWELTPEK